MFRFFRSIRQQLLNENKTAKYLKYALEDVYSAYENLYTLKQVRRDHFVELKTLTKQILTVLKAL